MNRIGKEAIATPEEAKEYLANIMGILDGSRPLPVPKGPLRPCARCSHNPDIPGELVPECESRVENGRVYYRGTCVQCSDLEFSERWVLRFDAAMNDKVRDALRAELDRWLKSGRKFTGTMPGSPRPPPPPVKPPRRIAHTDNCMCAECRAKAIALAFGEDRER